MTEFGNWLHVGNEGREDAQVFYMCCGGNVVVIYRDREHRGTSL